MVRGKGAAPVQEYLSPSERQSLVDEKSELEASLREVEQGTGSGTSRIVDANKIRKDIQKIEDAIDTRTPEKVKPKTRDDLYKEEEEIEDALIIGMPSRYEMDFPTKNPGAVRKHMAWCVKNKSLIERFVQIQRILRPMDPKSVEALRKDR